MLDRWGYLYFHTGQALAYAETALEEQRARTGGAVAGHGTSILNPHEPTSLLVEDKCAEIRRFMEGYGDELGPIPTHLGMLQTKLKRSRELPHQLEMYTNDILDDVRRIENDFTILLSKIKFYYLSPSTAKLYGKPQLFGDLVAKKFPKASLDVECAGNCLALGEPTACVLHLNRVMEIAVRKLARKLKFEPKPKDTFGAVLGICLNRSMIFRSILKS